KSASEHAARIQCVRMEHVIRVIALAREDGVDGKVLVGTNYATIVPSPTGREGVILRHQTTVGSTSETGTKRHSLVVAPEDDVADATQIGGAIEGPGAIRHDFDAIASFNRYGGDIDGIYHAAIRHAPAVEQSQGCVRP